MLLVGLAIYPWLFWFHDNWATPRGVFVLVTYLIGKRFKPVSLDLFPSLGNTCGKPNSLIRELHLVRFFFPDFLKPFVHFFSHNLEKHKQLPSYEHSAPFSKHMYASTNHTSKCFTSFSFLKLSWNKQHTPWSSTKHYPM